MRVVPVEQVLSAGSEGVTLDVPANSLNIVRLK